MTQSISSTGGNGHGKAAYYAFSAIAGSDCQSAAPIGVGTFSGDDSNKSTMPIGLACGPDGVPAWFSYTNPSLTAPQLVTASTCNTPVAAFPGGGVRVAVLDNCGTGASSLIACGSTCPSQSHQTVTWTIEPGATDLIRVLTRDIFGAAGTPYQLDVSSVALPPGNDTCAQAYALPTGNHLMTLDGLSADATSIPCAATSYGDGWFSYDNTSASAIVIEVKATAFDAGKLGLEAVANCGDTTSLACALSLGTTIGGPAIMCWKIPAGATHYFRVARLQAVSSGNVLLKVTAKPFVSQPFSSFLCSEQISLTSGGTQDFALDAGSQYGGYTYWILGSVSGTTPGLNIGGGITLPLNYDAYTQLTIANPFLGIFGNYIGVLAADGTASASFDLPAGLDAALAGITFNHAYIASATLGAAAEFVSNPISVTLVP